MGEESRRIRMKPGVYFRFINPEGSVTHFAPRWSGWKKVECSSPDGKLFPFYTRRWLPYSTNINGGQMIQYYKNKGWQGIDKLPPGWKQVNQEYIDYCAKIADAIDPQVAATQAIATYLGQIVDRPDGGEVEVRRLVQRELRRQEERIAKRIQEEEENVQEEEDTSQVRIGKIRVDSADTGGAAEGAFD